ncbi:MAG TPA: S8 family peptidase [Gaiellaceae bacterium]
MPLLPRVRRLSPLAAPLAVLLVSLPIATQAAPRSARVARGYVRLVVATDSDAEAPALAQRIERLQRRSVQVLRGPHLLAVRVSRRDALSLSRRLARLQGVRFVERNRVVSQIAAVKVAESVPTDPLWPHQWGPARIGAPAVWKLTKGSPRVVIAMLDTGVDPSQPDLRQDLVPGYDAVNGDDDPSDDNGHGTRTAGIAGAREDNGVGISGICPGCSIMPVKVLAANGSGTGFQIASGITWAADHGASIISMSLGGTQSDPIAAAVRYAEAKGVLVVAAAGNGGGSQLFYPAADPGVLSVAGTNPDDQLYPWSNRGSWVSVAAPGCDLTTYDSGGFGGFCGTSASAPVVAGLAGLALSYSPTSSAETIEHAIVAGSHPVAGIAGGRVDAVATLAALGARFRPAAATHRRPRSAARAGSHRRVPAARRRVLRARVRRGVLRVEWHLRLAVRRGRFTATLRSPKAGSCSVHLRSRAGVRRVRRHGHESASLAATVKRGTYGVDVRCSLRRPQPASLTVRAHFTKRRRTHGRRRVLEARGATVAVIQRRDPF